MLRGGTLATISYTHVVRLRDSSHERLFLVRACCAGGMVLLRINICERDEEVESLFFLGRRGPFIPAPQSSSSAFAVGTVALRRKKQEAEVPLQITTTTVLDTLFPQ